MTKLGDHIIIIYNIYNLLINTDYVIKIIKYNNYKVVESNFCKYFILKLIYFIYVITLNIIFIINQTNIYNFDLKK